MSCHQRVLLPSLATLSIKRSDSCKIIKRGPNLFFKYFYFLFGTGLFYPFRVPTKVQFFLGSLAGPLTLLHPKNGPTKLPKNFLTLAGTLRG